MLFFNFVWLFYLMVLINGYTISKRDVNDYTPDSFIDSLWEQDPGREPRGHHERRQTRGHEDSAATFTSIATKVTTIATRSKDSFWKRFRHRHKTTKSKHSHKDRMKTDSFHINSKKRHNYKNQKREISTESVYDKRYFKSTKDFFTNTKNNQIKFFNITRTDPASIFDNVTSVTSSLTTPKSTQTETTAKTLSTLQTALDSKMSSSSSTTTAKTTSAEWLDTAQLEALLDNIKAQAMQVLINNNPTVTSLVTNSVNEITFDADPFLHHIDQTTPHPKADAIIQTSNINKRTTEIMTTDVTTHNILRRSPVDWGSTMANSVEDALQNELKKVYKKLKHKVSSNHNLKTTPTTAHRKTTHTLKTTSPAMKTHRTAMKTEYKMKEKKPEVKSHHRIAKATRRLGEKKKISTTDTTVGGNPLTGIDDYKLIGLLEQMLLKTSENNIMRMVTTPYLTPRAQTERLSRRNVETLTDLKLKEQVEGFENKVMMPDMLNEVGDNKEDAATTAGSSDQGAGTFNTEGISFESISDKISYNDYVNGYKYYLKYQQEQEQDDEKFSPMIRYQAHKHHKVDDIGKFILGKIPQIRFARNIFDEIDMDDQDVSTKSDDSWFKKHFYVFLDSNPPKKFHTSETVTLKSALTEPSADPQPPADHRALVEDASVFNLDQLAQNLESYKAELSSTTISSLVKKIIEEGREEPVADGFMIKMMSMLLGGKDRRALNKVTPSNYQPEPRYRRHAKKSKHKETLEIPTTQKTVSEPSIQQKDKLSKLGVVQMIAKPTTVVKIPTKKKSKLKHLMMKLHLSRQEKASKKPKRHVNRKQRFVPFKRIKEMLLGSQHESHGTETSKEVNDFDIMTSEIDTFKAVKFSRVPNIDEMRKQIPDITEDLLEPEVVDTTESVARTRPAEDLVIRTRPAALDLNSSDAPMEFSPEKSQMVSNLTNEIEQMTMTQLEHYLVDYKNSMKGAKTQLANSATRPSEALEKASVQATKDLDEEDINALEDLEAQNNIKEDESIKLAKEEGSLEEKENSGQSLELNLDNNAPAEETMDVIREEIDKLKNKLTMYESLEETTEQKMRPAVSNVPTVTKVMFVPARIQKLENKSFERNNKNNAPKVANPQNLKPKREVIDFKSAIESLMLHESSDEANYRPMEKFSIPFIPIRRDSSHVTKTPNSMHAMEGYIPKKTLSQYSVSPDHFGELLLWHSDILDVDSLTTTTYAPWVAEENELAGYTTPNAALLANEVQDMKRFISNSQPVDDVKKVPSTFRTSAKCSNTTERSISMPVRTMMKEDFSLGDNEAVVLGQAQYFSFRKDDNFDYGSRTSKAEKIQRRAEKTETKARPQPLVKQMSVRSKWTNLSPQPNVIYNTSPRSQSVLRLWRTPTSGGVPVTKLLVSTQPLLTSFKINQAPEQHFSTPLPMDTQDFENFLKKSHLDVDSVTAPISDSEVSIKTEKLSATATVNDFKVLPTVKTTSKYENLSPNAFRLKSEKEYLTKVLNQIQSSAKNLSQIADYSHFMFSDDARFRRNSSGFKGISYSPKPATKIMKRRKIKKAKKTSLLPELDLSDYTDPMLSNNDNLDYESKYQTEELLKYTPETVNVEMTKHNNMLYFYIPGRMRNFTTSLTPDSMLAEMEKMTEQLPMELTTTELPKLIRNLRLRHKTNPKRVRISYHYDVVYENRPKKARTRGHVTTEEIVKKDVHNSEVDEVTTQLNRPGIKYVWAKNNTYYSKKPSQAKSWSSKSNVHRLNGKSKRNANASITEKPTLSKRYANPVTYTAQNVAAFEIYLDLVKSTQAAYNAPASEKNSFQVHISLPNDKQSINKRQLNPSKPVFSAKMSDAVNLEYQVPALEEKFTTECNSLSPGLYMLVDNVYKSGHVTLKPILSDISMLKPRQAVSVKSTTESTSRKCATTNNLELKKATLNKDFIAAVNEHLVQLYENFSSINSANKSVKRNPVTANDVKKNGDTNRRRRDVWPSLKEMLGGERTCSCHIKENHTLCPACVATDAVVDEIIFEVNNLANFMKDHCTEIQTFFWMNPNGGKKLTDSVHRLDRMLHDYYKRVKGKCQGKTCQTLASRLDKRTLRNRRRILTEVSLMPDDVQTIANDIANILKHRLPYNKNLMENGEEFLNIVDNCLPGLRYKKSLSNQKYKYLQDDGEINKSNYKREAMQLEKPIIADSGGTFWSDYINKRSTASQSLVKQPLMTETTLDALTHNINELFMLFNNLNLTDVDPLAKLVDKDNTQNIKKNKKSKKNKKQPKKSKKHRFHKKRKEKNPKDNTKTSTGAVNIDALLSMATEQSPTTHAFQVILSNVKENPSLHVKVDKITADTEHNSVFVTTATKHATVTNPTFTHKQTGTGHTEILSTGETIIFEEGCGVKNNFLNKLKHLFSKNNNSYTPSYNYVYEKRLARTPSHGLGKESSDVSLLAPANTITVITTPSGETVQGFTTEDTNEEPKFPKEQPKCPTSEELNFPTTNDSKYGLPELFKAKESKCPPNETPTDTPLLEYETPNSEGEDIITELTEQTFPTIIIIDEASTETATDEVTIDILSTIANEDAKDLLLSVLTFERQKLDDEFQKVRDSREVNVLRKETNDKLAEQPLLSDTSTTQSLKHPASSATGNYSLLSDLLGKMIRKGHNKSSTKSTTKDFTTAENNDVYNKKGAWMQDTEKSNSKLTSTTHAPITSNATQKAAVTPRGNTTTVTEMSSISPENSTRTQQKKASDARPAPRVCDLSATLDHVLWLQQSLCPSAFEKYVRNLTCYSFIETPEYFVVAVDKRRNNASIAKSKNQDDHNLKSKWDWIRKQRQINTNEDLITDEPEIKRNFNNEDVDVKPKIGYNMLVNFIADDDFEKFYRGEHGIYKMANSKRKRRKADATNLTRELTDLPPLLSTPNEILAMSGDSVILHCLPNNRRDLPDTTLLWTAEPGSLLRRPNVEMDGDDVRIDGVRESNAGSYVCKQGHSERRRFRVRVLTVPEFQIIATPIYSVQGSCGYTDLEAIRSLAAEVSHLVCPRGQCSVTIQEPQCLKDKSDGSIFLRATTSLQLHDPGVQCSVTCRRDLAAQLVKMAVRDVPTLVNVNVLIEGNKSKTLVPYTARQGSFAVTRNLRRKGSRKRKKRYPHLPPGCVDVLVNCPRQYRLISDRKICVADLPNSRDKEKHRKKPSHRPRKYEWWWYPPCGYLAAIALAGACAASGALCGRASRGNSWAEAARRPASPSRVILARLFKRSLSAFMNTDSQETRSFPSKRAPPPLPPIDFD